MTLPDWLLPYLPAGTAHTWEAVAPLVPPSGYLVGGTALTVHLRHRVSRDLDVFLSRREDLDALARALADVGRLHVSHLDDSTLNATLDSTRLQFLEAADQKAVAPTSLVGGLQVASVEDLAAMKLKVIVDRGELRDYFDLMVLDSTGTVPVEEGLAHFFARYDPPNPRQYDSLILRALSYTDDVEDDPGLPVKRAEVTGYWSRRAPAVVAALSLRGGLSARRQPPFRSLVPASDAPREGGACPHWMPRAKRRCSRHLGHSGPHR